MVKARASCHNVVVHLSAKKSWLPILLALPLLLARMTSAAAEPGRIVADESSVDPGRGTELEPGIDNSRWTGDDGGEAGRYHWADERAWSVSFGLGANSRLGPTSEAGATDTERSDAGTHLALDAQLGMRMPITELRERPLVAHPQLGYGYVHRQLGGHQLSAGSALMLHLDPLLALGVLGQGIATLDGEGGSIRWSLRAGLRTELVSGVFVIDATYQHALRATEHGELRLIVGSDLLRAIPLLRAGWTSFSWLFGALSR